MYQLLLAGWQAVAEADISGAWSDDALLHRRAYVRDVIAGREVARGPGTISGPRRPVSHRRTRGGCSGCAVRGSVAAATGRRGQTRQPIAAAGSFPDLPHGRCAARNGCAMEQSVTAATGRCAPHL